jgi:hypothetical protein
LWFCEKNKKKGLSIKFYLTKWDFQYICNSQVVESGERWYELGVEGGVRACFVAGMNIP